MLKSVLCLLACFLFTPDDSNSVIFHRQDSSHTQSVPPSEVVCRDVAYAKELPSPGPACEKELFARRGRPFMFPARNGFAFGISANPQKQSELHLWVDNQTDQAQQVEFCCGATLLANVDLYDAMGHLVLSKWDELARKAKPQRREMLQVCTCSGSYNAPAHTLQIVDSADVSDGYVLDPGHYTVAERIPAGKYHLEDEQRTHPPTGLLISLP